MTTLALLKAARELISDPAHWTQGMTARNSDGLWCQPQSISAVAWSIAGALWCMADTEGNSTARYKYAVDALDQDYPLPFLNIEDFNDAHTHAEVLALFDRTIARLESGVQP